jgi:hypothetical protein
VTHYSFFQLRGSTGSVGTDHPYQHCISFRTPLSTPTQDHPLHCSRTLLESSTIRPTVLALWLFRLVRFSSRIRSVNPVSIHLCSNTTTCTYFGSSEACSVLLWIIQSTFCPMLVFVCFHLATRCILDYPSPCTRPVVIPRCPVFSPDPFRQSNLNPSMFKPTCTAWASHWHMLWITQSMFEYCGSSRVLHV